MNDLLIKHIASGTLTNRWMNGKAGNFRDFDKNGLLRFCETDGMCNAYLQTDNEQMQLPIVCCGFVSWLILHWGQDRLTTYQNYLQLRLDKFKQDHKDEYLFDEEFEKAFYAQHRRTEESWIENYCDVFDYVTLEEADKLRACITNYWRIVAATPEKVEVSGGVDVCERRTIDAELLKPYFKPAFKGMGNNINYFDSLIDDLKTDRTAKEFAQIALMIYESNHMSARKPNAFASWYRVFCRAVGVSASTYKKKALIPYPNNLQKLFSYLS